MRFFAILAVCVFFAGLVNSLDKSNNCKCRMETGKRIVGGRIAHRTSWPWHASLSNVEQQPKETRKWIPATEKLQAHICGGVILNERWILTAADCVTSERLNDGRLSVGVGNDQDLIKIYDEGRINAREIIPFGGFNRYSLRNNVALVELERDLQFNSTVQPACLDTRKYRKNYGDVVATGFGHTSKLIFDPQTDSPVQVGSLSRFLRELDNVDISEIDAKCQESEDKICIDSKSTEQSVCFFDDGSPLHKTENGKTKVIGLGSDTNDTMIDENNHVVLCNGKFWYTRIGVFVDWIESWIGDEHC